ncbi:MAG: NAD(+) synthase [Treponemataceae bacterium]
MNTNSSDFGFIRLACVSPETAVANCKKNAETIISHITELSKKNVSIIVFPELCITSYTCGDLFFQTTLLEQAQSELLAIIKHTAFSKALVFVGLPLLHNSTLYNVAAVIYNGSLLAIIPKTYIPNYNEFYEKRYFASFCADNTSILLFDKKVPFGTKILINDKKNPFLNIAAEICEDLWAVIPPSSYHALHGASIIVNLSASNDTVSKAHYRKSLVEMQSSKLLCAYAYANAGAGESTTDVVYSGNSFIAENGITMAEKMPFASKDYIISDIDTELLLKERQKNTTFATEQNKCINHSQSPSDYLSISIDIEKAGFSSSTVLKRIINAHPFVPISNEKLHNRCREIIAIQAHGLIKRIKHTKVKKVVIGLSGGLDSTLAFLITIEAFKILALDVKGIIAITMPCFGTTEHTKNNALTLAKEFGTTIKIIPIKESVMQHFKDISHDEKTLDITYENCQARERTQVLMDVANQVGGLVIGTGDLSELALGWATYNGDHMSMYSVNASIPKTLVKSLVSSFSQTHQGNIALVLQAIIETPVSPELLPPVNGMISQKTEDIVGPYDLHDFFLYYFLRFGFSPQKILFLAEHAFKDAFDKTEIKKWLKIFLNRFFSQQFKRSCLPDGPKVGSICLSPRGDWRMPSDAESHLWIKELEELG